MTFLKNHPFVVEAFFDSSLVLTFGFRGGGAGRLSTNITKIMQQQPAEKRR